MKGRSRGDARTARMPRRRPPVRDLGPDRERMRDDVLRGLAQDPKAFPSQYLYDERGARLFERICETEEYYLTRTEIGILERNLDEISERIGPRALVVEPGSGSGVKTRMLLEALDEPAAWVPIDLSRDQLVVVGMEMERDFPELEVLPVCADFTGEPDIPTCRAEVEARVTWFPGSTIGNFTPEQAVGVLHQLARSGGEEGDVLIGVDLRKRREILEPAYDDAQGYSSEFARNILVRLNRELEADFDLEQYGYEAPWNEEAGRIEMALVSHRRQDVRIDRSRVELARDERVRTEYSYKYGLDEFEILARRAGLERVETWTDPDRLFSLQLLRPVG